MTQSSYSSGGGTGYAATIDLGDCPSPAAVRQAMRDLGFGSGGEREFTDYLRKQVRDGHDDCSGKRLVLPVP